jgi:hypothetical protein
MKHSLLLVTVLALLLAAVLAPAAQARETNPEEWQEEVDAGPAPVPTEPDETAARLAMASSDPLLLAGSVAAGSACGASGGSCNGWSGVSGEGNMLKVYSPVTMQRVVYLQCGKKVSVLEPPGCCCSPKNARYTYSCQRPPTIYVTIPCW